MSVGMSPLATAVYRQYIAGGWEAVAKAVTDATSTSATIFEVADIQILRALLWRVLTTNLGNGLPPDHPSAVLTRDIAAALGKSDATR